MSAQPDIAEELEAALDEDHDAQYERFLASVEAEPPAEGIFESGKHLFQIDDRASAEWALRKIIGSKRKIAEATTSAGEQIAAVMAKADRILEPVRANLAEITEAEARTVSFFEGLLKTYHRKCIAEDPKATSIKFGFGKLTSRQGQDKYEFGPEFIEWAKENAPELLRVKTEVQAVDAKKAITVVESADGMQAVPCIDGQLVPGVEVIPGERSFSVEAEPAIAIPKDGAA